MTVPYIAVALLLVITVYAAVVSFRTKAESPTWFFPEHTSRRAKVAVFGLTVVLVTGSLGWLGVSARKSTRPSSRFLIPEGYTGWVRVEFEVPDAPALPEENGEYVLKIPSGGVLTTSSPERYGWANDSYYFYTSNGVRRLPGSGPGSLIWGKINGEAGTASAKRKYEEFFVGTKQQFTNQPNPQQ